MSVGRKTMATVLVIAGAYAGAGWLASAAPSAASEAKPFKPVQPIGKMMKGQQKLSKQIKDDLQDKAWDDAEKLAWILAEMANVNHYQRDDGDYQKFADTMSTQCVGLAKALKQKNEDKSKELFNQIGKTCNSCHDQFAKKKRK